MRRQETQEGRSVRLLRVGEQVRHILSELLARGDVHDETLQSHLVSVTEVRMSPDLKIATAFVSPLGAGDADAVVGALNKHAKFIRGRITGALRQMKYMPQIRFRLDTSFDNFARINQLLKSPEVARDLDDQNKNNDKDED